MRSWLLLVSEENDARRRWWELLEGWFLGRGIEVGGENRAQEKVYEAMVNEETLRRWSWWIWARDSGWGDRGRFVEWMKWEGAEETVQRYQEILVALGYDEWASPADSGDDLP